jgi:hypothetical protein
MAYTGQTAISCYQRFKEQFSGYKYGNGKSTFAQDVLVEKYSIEPIENIVDFLYNCSSSGPEVSNSGQ